MPKPIQFTVDGGQPGDPASGQTDYVNTSLQGKEFYVERFQDGPLPYNQYSTLSGGGFRKTTNFLTGEVYTVFLVGITEAVDGLSYTNGFNYARVINALINRIGFKQPTITGYNIVDSDNQMSLSGRYFDDFHALVRVKNIKDTQEDGTISDANFNAYLAALKKGIIMRCLNGVLGVGEQLERTLLFYKLRNTPDQLVNNDGKFVGFEIDVTVSDTISVQIVNCVLQFNENVTFPIYLFIDGKKSPIWSQSVTATAYESTVVNFSDLFLNYILQNTKGYRFYLGYFQSDLGTAKAIRQQPVVWNKQYCFCCNSLVAEETVIGSDFDRTRVAITKDIFGINLEISCFRDHTNAIIRKAALFDEVIGLQMAYCILEQIIYSSASNATQRKLLSEVQSLGIQLDLQGAAAISDSPQITGLKQRIERELKRVKDEFYPKNKSQTINWLNDCDNNSLNQIQGGWNDYY